MDDGSFSMVLDHAAEFDISRLENVMLRTTYPALRMTISEYLDWTLNKVIPSNYFQLAIG